MAERLDGRELLAIRARTVRARDGQHQSLTQTETDRETLLAERDALKAAIAEVRRLCDLTIAASCRVQAIDQAHDTLAALDRVLDTRTPTEETEPGLVVRPDDLVVVFPNHYDDRLFVHGRDIAVARPTEETPGG